MTVANWAGLISVGLGLTGTIIRYYSGSATEQKQSAWFAEALPKSNEGVDERNRRRAFWGRLGFMMQVVGSLTAAVALLLASGSLQS